LPLEPKEAKRPELEEKEKEVVSAPAVASLTWPRGASSAEVRRTLIGGEESEEKTGGREKGNLNFFFNKLGGNGYFSVWVD
jgi:hypothetical protein